MSGLTLRLRDGVSSRVDVSGIDVETLASQDPARAPIHVGGRATVLGDVFDLLGATGTGIRFVGTLDAVDGIGARCRSGTIVVEGSVGHRAGAEMTGGSVEIHGNAGDDAGLAMDGGILHIHGSAGERLGAAFPGERRGMTGGEIVVTGSVGHGAATLIRRGLVAVGGDTGAATGHDMIAGTLVVLGRLGPEPGIGNRRGTIVAMEHVPVPSSYRPACVYAPPHVRLLLRHLQARSGLPVTGDMIAGQYRRYCGDAAGPGKGELLEWIQP